MLTCGHGSKTNHQLLQAGQTASDLGVGDLGLVQWHNHDENTDSEACNQAASVQVSQVHCASLKTTAEAEDSTTHQNSPPSSQIVSCGSGQSSAKESSTGEHRDHGSPVISCQQSMAGGRASVVDAYTSLTVGELK
jgi:hypothetical protein